MVRLSQFINYAVIFGVWAATLIVAASVGACVLKALPRLRGVHIRRSHP